MSSSSPPPPPWPKETGVWETYDLHCHCGAIRYSMKISPPLYQEHTQGQAQYDVSECNCSYCERNGILAVHPLASNVEFTRGLEDRAEYRSGAKMNPHWFCRKCASNVGMDLSAISGFFGSEPRLTINVRMLKDFDMEKLKIKKVTMVKNMGPKYSIDD